MGIFHRLRSPWTACLVLLTVGIAANFSTMWRPASAQKWLGIGDSHAYFGPRAAFLDQAIARGELPEWSPLTLCGQPFAANPQTGALYPPNLLRSALTFEPTPLRTHYGIAILSALHLLVAGLGTFALARAHRLSTGASLVSAWAFAFSASFMRRVVCNQFLGVVSWLPLLLLAVKRGIEADERRSRRRGLVAAGLLFGLSLLGGFPQLSIYIGTGLAVYVLAHRLLVAGAIGAKTLGQDGLALILVASIGALIAAPMLLPAVEFIGLSTRTDPALTPEPGLAGVSQFAGLARLLDALVIYPGAPGLALNYRAAGATVFILALLGLFHPRRREAVLQTLLFLTFLDCSLGPPFPVSSLLSIAIPSPLIAPSRGFILACLPLALLAGFGVDALRHGAGKSSNQRVLRSLTIAGLGAGALLVLSGKMDGPVFLSKSYEVLLLPLLLCVVSIAKLWRPGIWSSLLLALVVAETVTWNQAFVPHMMEKSPFEGAMDSLEESQAMALDNQRYSYERSTESLYRMRPTINGYDPLQLQGPRSVMCSPEMESLYSRSVEWGEVCASNQRGNLFLKRPFWLARQFVREILPDKGELYPVATTVFLQTDSRLDLPEVSRESLSPSSLSPEATERVLAGIQDLVWKRVKRTEGWRLDLPELELSPEHSALRLRYSSDGECAVDVMFIGNGRREPGLTLNLEATGGEARAIELPLPDFSRVKARLHCQSEAGPPQLLEVRLASDPADENELISIREWNSNSVAVDVGPLEGPRMLTFVDSAYPGWSATVDGREVPIFLAQDAFKAIELAPGSHEVRFTYRSGRLRFGLLVCLATLVACGLAMRGSRAA